MKMPFSTLRTVFYATTLGLCCAGAPVVVAQTVTTTPRNTGAPAAISPGSAAQPGIGNGTPANAVAATAPPRRLNLQQCVDIALQNNITVRQGQLQVQGSELQLRQSRLNRLPNLNAFVSQGLNFGRNINPATNQFIDRAVRSNNLQLSTNVPIYQGGLLNSQIAQNESAVQASQQELSATQNNVALNVVQQYLNSLTGQEQLVIAQRNLAVTQEQLNRTQKLVDAGTTAEVELFNLRAQLAQNQLDIVNAQNQLELAKLALLQAMNVPAGPFEVESINVPDPQIQPYDATSQQVFDIAVGSQPQIRGADLRTEAARRGVDVAKAGLFPTLSFGGALTSIYSSVGLQRFIADGTVTEQEIGFVSLGGNVVPVTTPQPGGRFENYSFFEQLNNNFNRSFSLNLRIPIFSNRQLRNQIVNATIQQQNAQLNADNTRLQLRQTIETAYTQMVASANRYVATQAQVTQLERVLQAAESRFNAGALNAFDYNIAKTNLDRARASLVQAKYDYVFRTKILDFYQNKPISF